MDIFDYIILFIILFAAMWLLKPTWYDATAGVIPEFDLIVLPVPITIMFVLLLASSKKRKKYKISG